MWHSQRTFQGTPLKWDFVNSETATGPLVPLVHWSLWSTGPLVLLVHLFPWSPCSPGPSSPLVHWFSLFKSKSKNQLFWNKKSNLRKLRNWLIIGQNLRLKGKHPSCSLGKGSLFLLKLTNSNDKYDEKKYIWRVIKKSIYHITRRSLIQRLQHLHLTVWSYQPTWVHRGCSYILTSLRSKNVRYSLGHWWNSNRGCSW